MREIWMMQPRLEKRSASSALTLLEQPRFRAGLDFLRLRGEVGEADPALAVWWEALFNGSDGERVRLIDEIRGPRGPKRVKKADAGGDAPRARASEPAPRDSHDGALDSERGDAPDEQAETGDAAGEGADGAPKRRRRRRRKPAGADGADASAAPASSGGEGGTSEP